jgi:hypothetical protein
MEQLLAHAWGDYILQSDWMANNKTNKSFACLCHVLTYGLPFLFLTLSPLALIVIVGTHFFIDRFRLAKYVVYLKNFIAPSSVILETNEIHTSWSPEPFREIAEKYRWENCKATGYPSEIPAHLATWLMIFADNILHLTINYFALKYL